MGLTLGAGIALGGIASALGGLFGSASSATSVRKSNEANRELAEYQNEWNLAQWHRENEYNSPQAQMQRLKQAGINPNLAYANGTINNVSASSPKAATATMQPYTGYAQDYSAIADNALKGMRLLEDVKSVKIANELALTNKDYLQAQILNKQADTELKFEQKMGLSYDNFIKKELRDFNIDAFKTNLAIQKEHLNIAKADLTLKQLNYTYTDRQIIKLGEEIANLKENRNLTKQQAIREKLDNNLRRIGVNPHDTIIHRIIGRCLTDPTYLNTLLGSIKNLFDSSDKSLFNDVKDWWKNSSPKSDTLTDYDLYNKRKPYVPHDDRVGAYEDFGNDWY